MPSIEHIALYVDDLERARGFYETYFGGVAGTGYHNPSSGLRTYFLSFNRGARLELMTRPVLDDAGGRLAQGFNHVAFSVGSAADVDALTARLGRDGYPALSGPRTTGDGYYESVVPDPDGNLVEITA
ncbi:VOC family protein [Tessaracoccus palaemonis]|uniref:VOC family protein n=1 Tax=Tessaracoccus palaemonis TaxID=2829499 RepID=A0ABX8SHJ8_9ACTN|nr:VOC family protein [Tessaracoccus palaemonis]QXT62871.1 VOC family protein [Tessaracoccus palaemonis]